MPFAGGIIGGDAYFFYQRQELSLYTTAETSCWLSPLLPVWICLSGFLLLFAAYFLSRKYRFNYLYGIVVFLCCFALGTGITEGRLHRTDFPFSDKAEVYQAVIQETPETKERSILCRVRIEGKVGANNLWVERYNHTALLYLSKDSASTTLKQGDRLWVHARLMPPTNNGNPDEFDYIRYFLRKGGSATAYVPEGHWQVVGYETSRTLRQASLDYRRKVIGLYQRLGFQGDNLAILSALTVGDKENLSENILETYSIAGASHVLALSGLHIGFLYALLFFLLSRLWKRWGFFKPFGLTIILLLLWAFAFFTGLSSSVVRSVMMCTLVTLSCLQPEKPLSMNTLAATAFLMLLYNPLWLFDVGFQLSFTAVSAIILIQPKLYALFAIKQREAAKKNALKHSELYTLFAIKQREAVKKNVLIHIKLYILFVIKQREAIKKNALIYIKLYILFALHRLLRYVWGLLTVSVAAQIGTAPLVIFYFHRFSTHFLLTNLWVIPLVTVILYSAILMLLLTPFPTLQHGLARVVDILLDIQNAGLRQIEHLPVSSVDGLWTDVWEILLFYLSLLFLFRCLKLRTVRSIYTALSCLFLFSAYHTVSICLSLPQRSINFYNVRNCPAVHCLTNSKYSWLACADSLPDTTRLHRTLRPYWSHIHLVPPKIVTTDYSVPGFTFRNHLVFYAGKCICLLHDNRWQGKISSQPLNVDYLYISNGYNGNITELTSLFHIHTVILDSSLPAYRINFLKKECGQLAIPYISIKDRGALCIRL